MSIALDTIPGCVEELTECNREVAEFADQWFRDAGALKSAEKLWERLFRAAMRGTTGKNADERAATAQVAIESMKDGQGLAADIERLVGAVEGHKTRFKAIERRASNAQSILAAHRDAQKMDGFVPREARQMARAA